LKILKKIEFDFFYDDFFSVKFVKDEKAPLWHEDVQCFSVFDKETNELKGQFYLDLWPRSGK
jgi:thimet oligopeptidase